jgi:hypothetical protein
MSDKKRGKWPDYSGGYEIGYLAFRHSITEEQARMLIDEVGPDRRLLDAAALRYKGISTRRPKVAASGEEPFAGAH